MSAQRTDHQQRRGSFAAARHGDEPFERLASVAALLAAEIGDSPRRQRRLGEQRGAVDLGSREKLRGVTPDQAFDPAFLSRTFVVWKDRVSPPAWVGLCDAADFKDAPSPARLLTQADEAAIQALAEGCGEVAWKQSKLALDREHNFGIFDGKDLVAASGYLVMGDVLAYVGVITHPQHRGKGYAKKVTAASIRSALKQGLIPMWRTPQANESAIALGGAVGFKPYALTRDVKLVEDEF